MLGMVGKHGSLIITELIEANIVVFPQLKLLDVDGKNKLSLLIYILKTFLKGTTFCI